MVQATCSVCQGSFSVWMKWLCFIYDSVYPEHRLLVTALTLFNIQSDAEEPPFSEEELTLVVHGNPGFGRETRVCLADFESEATVPDWLPADRWEDLLTFSVLPKPLEGLCVRVAENSEAWKKWYNLPQPEVTACAVWTIWVSCCVYPLTKHWGRDALLVTPGDVIVWLLVYQNVFAFYRIMFAFLFHYVLFLVEAEAFDWDN